MATRIAITGATGFLARYLIAELRENGFDVLLLSRGKDERKAAGTSYTDYSAESLGEVLGRGVDAIAHLAGNRAVLPNLTGYYDVITATETLYSVASDLGIANIVFASSISVYSGELLPYRESLLPQPSNNYGLQKLICEQIGNLFSGRNLNVKNLRLAHIYGANENNNYMVNRFLRQAFNKEQIVVHSNSQARREMLYAKDAAKAIRIALEHEAVRGTFNIGSGEALTNVQIGKTIAAVLSPGLEVRIGDAREELHSSFMDSSEAERKLGYSPSYSMSAAVADIGIVMSSKVESCD